MSTGTLRYAKITERLNQMPKVQWLRRFIFIHGYMYTHTFVFYIYFLFFTHTHLYVYMYCIYTLYSTSIYIIALHVELVALSFKKGGVSFKFSLQLCTC
jgi:hypothetical protein